jgi:hypothetical protein
VQMFGSVIQEVKKVVEYFLCKSVERNRVIGIGAYFVRFSIKNNFLE